AGTAISAALGYAQARDLRGTNEDVVAIVGDSSLTSGMAIEALNHAGQLKTNLKVVLNDNSMSIANAVGALSYHFAKLRSRPFLQELEQKAKEIVEHFPGGETIHRTAQGLKLGMTNWVSPKDGPVFEHLGFTYLGPIDGHDTEQMIEILTAVKELKGPVLVHVVTVKGKGCDYAENDARCFHGVTPFDTESGKMEKKVGNPAWTKVFGEYLDDLAESDKRVCAITAAMPDGTGLTSFSRKFPDRFFDVAIAEQHGVTFAGAMAAAGMRPVVAIYSTFLQRGFDQILHDVCIQNLPVIFCLDRAGLVGDDGPTHHGVFDLSFLRMMPGIVIMAPATPNELGDMLLTAVQHDGPIAIRYPRGTTPDAWEKRAPEPLAIGRGQTLRQGDDIALVGVGATVRLAQQAAERLSTCGIEAEVINARFVKPLDEQRLRAAAEKCGRMIVLEENALAGGFGSAVLELLSESNPQCCISRVGIPDRFIDHATLDVQKEQCGLTVNNVVSQAMSLCGKSASGRVEGRG
ncbi:MAG: 1-deoxy-D-xylulose-5-phosphate synthase, partial [Armatimonadota bacterium]